MTRLRTSVWTAAAAIACSITAGPGFAATITWVGDGPDGAWSDGDNWDAGSAPDPDDDLVFAGSDQTSTFNNLSHGIRYGSLSFDSSAAAFTLAGNDVAIANGGSILNQSTETQNISLNLEARGNLTINADAGDITINGAIDLVGNDTRTLSIQGDANTRITGFISGEAGLNVQGNGQVTLTRANTFTGGTTLDGGTLLLEHHQALGQGALTVTDDSTFGARASLTGSVANEIQINAGNTLTLAGSQQINLAGNLSGDGDIEKIGSTVAVLSGQDSTDFTGTLTVDAGTLRLATQLGGDVVLNDGELVIARNEAIAEDQTLTLAGGTLTAGGSFFFDADVVLASDMLIEGGDFRTLELGGPFEVQGDRAIRIGADTRLMIESLTADTAGRTLTQDGPGWLEITGDSLDFAGELEINAGTLAVNGDLAADLNINSGATFQGTGSVVGDVRINNGAQHNAGQTIEGSYTLATGGQLNINYGVSNGSISATTLEIDGDATLQQNSVVSVAGQGSVAVGDTIVAISTTDGIDDLGALLDTPASFLVWSAAVVGNDYVLTVEQGTVFLEAARGNNQRAVARALDRMVVTGVDQSQQALLDQIDQLIATDEAAYNRALRQLAPEQAQAMPTTTIQIARNMQGAVSNRLAQQRLGIVATPNNAHDQTPALAAGPGLSLASAELSPAMMAHAIGIAQQRQPQVNPRLQTRDFVHDWHVDVQTFGIYQDQDTAGERTGYRGRTAGFVLSADRSLTPHWRVGMNVGYAHSNFDFRNNRGSAYVDHLRGGPYASYTRGDWFVDAALTVGYHRTNLSRRVNVGQFGAAASSRSNNFDVATYIGTGYDFHFGRSFTLTPFASLDHLYYYQSSYTESGAGPANLHVDRSHTNSVNATLGARLIHIIPVGDTVVVPELSVGYRYAVLNDHDTTARFVGTPTSFTITNDLDNEHTAIIGAGASALIGDTISVYGHVQSEIASTSDMNHLFRLGLQYRF